MKTTFLSIAALAGSAFAGILDFQSQYNTQIAPEVQELGPSETFKAKHPDAKTTKIRYGPLNIPNVNKKNFMYKLEGETGVLTTIKAGLKKPCTDCVLLGIRANLELPDGKLALINEGYWLHHMVMTTMGNKHADLVCAITPGERFYSSGNERTPTTFSNPENDVNTGVHVKSGDTWGMEIELMNLRKTDAATYLTLTYEYVPTAQPTWKHTRAVWMDVTGCFKASEAAPPKDKARFSLESAVWTSTVSGDMLGVGGHVHDGGKDVEIKMNDKLICTSKATYGGSPEYIQPAWTKEGAMAHISRMSFCQSMGSISKGDKIQITSNYDMSKNMPMKNAKGGLSTVMGIAIMYVVV